MNEQAQTNRVDRALGELQAEFEELSREVAEHDSRAADARARCQNVRRAIDALKRGLGASRQQTLSAEQVRAVVEEELPRHPGKVPYSALREAVKAFAKSKGLSARGAHRVLARVLTDLGLEEQGGVVWAIEEHGS